MSKKSVEAAAVTAAPEGAAAVTKADKKAVKAAQKAAKAEKKAEKKLKKATKEAKKAVKKNGKAGNAAKPAKRGFGSPVRNLVITALMSLLLGVAFLIQPTLVYTYCGYAIGGLIALVGVIYIIIYFCRKPVSGVYRSEFVIGLVALLAGAYVALNGLISTGGGATMTFALIVRIIGVFMAADGILKLQYTLDIARMKYARWWVALIMSLLGIAVGVLTFMGIAYALGENAGLGGMMMLGIFFCFNGLLDLVVMTVVAVRNHKAEKAALLAEAEAMVAAAAKEENPDFFTGAGTSAEETIAPSSAVTSAESPAAAPAPMPEPEPAAVPAPKQEPEAVLQPEPQIEHAAAEPPAQPEPELPEPVLATPAEGE